MKKLLKIILILLILSGVGYLIYKIYIVPDEKYQSIYLVPGNAAYIIETDDPFDIWNKIVYSDAWNNLKSNEYMRELNNDIQSLDSLISSKRFLLRLLSARKVLISSHPYKNGKYEHLYVVDLKKITKFKNLTEHITRVLGSDFRFTTRDYNGNTIYELFDKKEGEMYYFAMVKSQLIYSSMFLLVEKSIDGMEKMEIGRNLHFLEISKKISGKGLLNVYINSDHFYPYLATLMGKNNTLAWDLFQGIHFTGLSFDFNREGEIHLDGYGSLNDSVYSYLYPLVNSGKGGDNIASVIPGKIASYVNIGFHSAEEFLSNIEKTLSKETHSSYKNSLESINKQFKVDIQSLLFSWIDDEIGFVQTQASNLGKENEFALVLEAKNKKKAIENLEQLAKQVKKNSPVKFKTIQYKGHDIHYLHIPGIFKLMFGKLLNKLEKPYFTVIDNFVVFSNHPYTLKIFIDNYEEEKVLAQEPAYLRFRKAFDTKSSLFVYIHTPVFMQNLTKFMTGNTAMKLEKNKYYFNSFPRLGLQAKEKDELLSLKIYTRYEEQVPEYDPVVYSIMDFASTKEPTSVELKEIEEENEIVESLFVIDDLDAREYEEFYENGELKLEVKISNGLKNGMFKEYYPDGTLKVKGKYKNGVKEKTWKYYDKEGNMYREIEYNEGEPVGE